MTTSTKTKRVRVYVGGHRFMAKQLSAHQWSAHFPMEDPKAEYVSIGATARDAAEQIAALYGL